MAYNNGTAVTVVKLTTAANQAFPAVGPQTWNDLPDDISSAIYYIFRNLAKTDHQMLLQHEGQSLRSVKIEVKIRVKDRVSNRIRGWLN